MQSIAQAPPITDNDSLRARHRGFHGQSQPRPHRIAGDLPGPSGSDDRMRRMTGSTRLRQSLRDSDLRQQPQQDQAYGPRVPFWRPGQRQSLYDWAPATPPEEDFENRSLPPLVDGGELNDEMLRNAPFSQRADSPSPLISLSQSQTRAHRDPTVNIRMYESLFGTPIDPSFQSTFMQPIRQNPRRPIRPRSQWHGWSWEREHEREGRDDASRSRLEWRDAEVMLRSRPFRIRSENYRDHIASASSSCELEEAIKYLAKLRTSTSLQESLQLAGFDRGDDWLKMLDEIRFDDLLLDTHFLHVAETSWLKVGGVFWGNVCATATAGTMEAFTDFQKPASDKTSITTYLEGEIIDFKTHSLETFNFPSNIKDDAQNWRKLEPFCQLSNEQLVKSLVSRKFMKGLTDNWVFMRWKEKCFITPQTSPDVGVLTIGGFYFLSLRRSDGQIQGFYYDPMSQPFQELNLKPRERLFPTYEFR
ncbi:hypothetical protein Q9L58_008126 [Maublancomyces gigas]|uniref:Vacuolar import and degradation protein-domain-containing protein n=1 Tax=Discina gigas TaxID=1032678 RepID=A0ABR3GAI1_9PEZI